MVIEGPAFSSASPGAWDRAGLWWLIVEHLVSTNTPVAVCPPSTLKKFATGNGRAQKADMRVAWLTRTGEDIPDDNQVDAAWLATAGTLALGRPVMQLPVHNRASLAKIDWPDGVDLAGLQEVAA